MKVKKPTVLECIIIQMNRLGSSNSEYQFLDFFFKKACPYPSHTYSYINLSIVKKSQLLLVQLQEEGTTRGVMRLVYRTFNACRIMTNRT